MFALRFKCHVNLALRRIGCWCLSAAVGLQCGQVFWLVPIVLTPSRIMWCSLCKRDTTSGNVWADASDFVWDLQQRVLFRIRTWFPFNSAPWGAETLCKSFQYDKVITFFLISQKIPKNPPATNQRDGSFGRYGWSLVYCGDFFCVCKWLWNSEIC